MSKWDSFIEPVQREIKKGTEALEKNDSSMAELFAQEAMHVRNRATKDVIEIKPGSDLWIEWHEAQGLIDGLKSAINKAKNN